MNEWLSNLAGDGNQRVLFYAVLIIVALILLLIAIRMINKTRHGGFAFGRKARPARLTVVDVTNVDAHRRLVLVRRDNVEHLILIGGPSDVVVEQGILTFIPDREIEATRTRADKLRKEREFFAEPSLIRSEDITSDQVTPLTDTEMQEDIERIENAVAATAAKMKLNPTVTMKSSKTE